MFTSGGTEANNLALLGQSHAPPGRVLIAALEHPSTLAAGRQLQRQGWQVDWIRARECGQIDLDHLQLLLEAAKEPPCLVSVMLANHETGVLQPVREVVQRCQPQGIPVHTDAVQAIGKIPVHFASLGVTYMSVAAHKFYGPCGIGALIVRGKTPLRPILYGGAQQLATRPGTEPVALVIGLLTALKAAQAQQEQWSRHLAACRDELQHCLGQLPEVLVNGTATRLPQTLNVSFLGVDRQALLMALDLAGVYCSSGSACASGSSEPSPVLQAMGLPRERVTSAIRLSVGVPTREADVSVAADRILKAVNQLRARISR